MQYVAIKEKRVQNLIMLQVNLQVVSRPGVLFSTAMLPVLMLFVP